MKRYIVKGTGKERTFVEIIAEKPKEYIVMVRRVSEWETKENRESMGKELFATCIRTGYLTEVNDGVPFREVERKVGKKREKSYSENNGNSPGERVFVA